MSGEEQFGTTVFTVLRMLYAVFCGTILASVDSPILKVFSVISVVLVVLWQIIIVWNYVDRIKRCSR